MRPTYESSPVLFAATWRKQLHSPSYGAPTCVHSPVKPGYHNTRYLPRITFTPKPNGENRSNHGHEWYGVT